MNELEVLAMIQAVDAADVELCQAANFFEAEGVEASELHEHGELLLAEIRDSWMNGDNATRKALSDVLEDYGHFLEELNSRLCKLAEKLP